MNRALLFFLLFFTSAQAEKQKSIILLPAGHAHAAGRLLYEKYERGVSYELALEIKKKAQEKNLNIEVPFHIQGDQDGLIQYVNSLNPEIVLQLGLYKSKTLLPEISITSLSYDPLKDSAIKKQNIIDIKKSMQTPQSLAQYFWEVNQAQATICSDYFSKNLQGKVLFLGKQYAPCKTLLGYQAPSMLIEIGLRDDADWKSLTEYFVAIVEKINNSKR